MTAYMSLLETKSLEMKKQMYLLKFTKTSNHWLKLLKNETIPSNIFQDLSTLLWKVIKCTTALVVTSIMFVQENVLLQVLNWIISITLWSLGLSLKTTKLQAIILLKCNQLIMVVLKRKSMKSLLLHS